MRKILSKISGLRIKRGLSRGKMADAIGVNTSTYTKMEKGIYLISIARLHQIAGALDVTFDALLDNVNPEMDYLKEQYLLTQEQLERINEQIILEQSKLIELYEKLK